MKKLITTTLMILVIFIAGSAFTESITEIGISEGDIIFHADNTIYWNTPKEPHLEIYYKVPYQELQFSKIDGNYMATYEISCIIYDNDDNQLTGKVWKNDVKLNSYQDIQTSGNFVIGRLPIELPIPSRKVVVMVEDLGSGERSKIERDIDKSVLHDESILISELAFASNIEPVVNDSLFLKGDLNVQPNPSRVFGSDHPVFYVYYELYDFYGKNNIEIEYQIQSKKGKELHTEKVDYDEDQKEQYITFDIRNFKRGYYRIIVTATQGEHKTKRIGEFRVIQSLFTQDYDMTLYQLSYIAKKKEMEKLKNLEPEERINGLLEFWKKRDPTPTTARNEALIQFTQRIRYANEQWDTFIPGWQTDRGRIFIKYGPPDDIEYHPFERGLGDHWADIPPSMETLTVHAYQIWRYYDLDDFTGVKKFIFIDYGGRGKYELYNLSDEDR